MSTCRVSGPTITVLVGAEEKQVWVHETPLRAASKFFDAALGGEWKEAQARSVRLPEEDHEFFLAYVYYIYTGSVMCKDQGTLECLFKLHYLGGRLMDDVFQDTVMTCLMARTLATVPNVATVSFVYANTAGNDPLRLFMDDRVLCHGVQPQAGNAPASSEALPDEFLINIGKVTAMSTFKRDDFKHVLDLEQMCRYHKHGKDVECGILERLSPEKLANKI